MAQRKRAGPITQRSVDRNYALLLILRKLKQILTTLVLYGKIFGLGSIDFVVIITKISIDGSVVECSPATRAARVRFPVDAFVKFPFINTVPKRNMDISYSHLMPFSIARFLLNIWYMFLKIS